MPEAPPAPQKIEPRPVALRPPMAPKLAEPAILPSLFGAGYGTYRTKPTSFLYSYGIVTVGAILLIFIASMAPPVAQFIEQLPATEIVLSPSPAVGHDSGGGTHEKAPASKGAPPKMAKTVPLAPPTVHPVPEPVLPTPASVLGPTAPPPVLTATMGLPAGVSGPASNGSGSGGGAGSIAFELRAAPAGTMVGDECGTFTLDNSGRRDIIATSGRTAADCWSR